MDFSNWNLDAHPDTGIFNFTKPEGAQGIQFLPAKAPTPNLDRLAAERMRFVNYYVQSSCTAGRASFITGRIPIRSSLSSVRCRASASLTDQHYPDSQTSRARDHQHCAATDAS